MSERGAATELRAVLIGYGLAGRVFHAPLITSTDGLQLVAVVTGSPGRQAQVRSDLPESEVWNSVDTLWRLAGEVDIAVIAAATPAHVSLSRAAPRAGVRTVVVDKPVAPSAAAARRVTAEAAQHGALLVPFHNRRWDSDHLTLRRLLASGALGTVLRHESRFERWRPIASADTWRETTDSEHGGGVLLDIGTHLIDQALQLYGPVETVYAEVAARRGGADDDVFLALQHRSGVLSHLWANALAAAPGPRLRVLGDGAAFVVGALDGQEDALRAGVRPGDASYGVEDETRWGSLLHGDAGDPVTPERGDWPRFYTDLVAHVRHGAPPPATYDEAIDGLRVIDAARRSARSRATVRL